MEGWKMRVEILNRGVREYPVKATTEQRLEYGEGMSLWAMLPPHLLPIDSFLSGFLVQLFKERRRELSRMKVWGFLATITHLPLQGQ